MKVKILQKTVSAKGEVVYPGQSFDAPSESWPKHRIDKLKADGHIECEGEETTESQSTGEGETQTMDDPQGMERAAGQAHRAGHKRHR